MNTPEKPAPTDDDMTRFSGWDALLDDLLRGHGGDAAEALRLGLANWVVEPEGLMTKTMEIANRLAAGPTVAYRYMKENLNRALAGDVDDCMDLEATHHVHCGQTTDHKEATKAFVAKREPVFIGR